MGYNEHHLKALEARGNALASKKFALKMKEKALADKEEMNRVLFGDKTDYGILSVIKMYYEAIAYGNGIKTSTPCFTHGLGSAKEEYAANLEKSVSPEGDGEGGVHPPDPKTPSSGVDEINNESVWFKGFSPDNAPTHNGISQYLERLAAVIGVEARNIADNRGPFITLEQAETERNNQRGSGVLGSRTENSEIVTGAGNPPVYYVGKNGVDFPDAFTDKNELLGAVGKTVKAVDLWRTQHEFIIHILNGDAEPAGDKAGWDILTEYKVELPVGDIKSAESYVSFAGDWMDLLKNYAKYFDGFPDTASSTDADTRAEFNGKLNSLKKNLEGIREGVNKRCGEILGLFDDVGKGVLKHLAFWAGKAAQKPDGPYALYAMSEAMLSDAEAKITRADKDLNFFDGYKARWLMKPSPVTAYETPVLDLDGVTVKEKKLTVSWGMVLPANTYCLLMKKASNINNFSNDLWDTCEKELDVCDETPETGLVRTEAEIPLPNEPVFFRVVAGDVGENRMGRENTCSPQSDIVGEPIPFSQLENRTGLTVLSVDEKYGLRDMQYLLINGNEIIQIKSVSKNSVQLVCDYCGAVSRINKVYGYYGQYN